MIRIDTQPGPQTVAAESDADIVIMGGSAGGGKTFWLCYEAAKYIDVPGYQAAFFRRTYPELTGSGSIWDEAEQLYPLLGGESTLSPLQWTFPTDRVKLEFRHLQHEKSAERHKSKQYARVLLDELCDFTEKQFWKLWARCRSMSGVKPGIRASCNPDPDSFVRRLIAWWIGEDGYAITERSGVTRYFVRAKRDLVWADTKEELLSYVDNEDEITSLCFVRSTVYDNQILLRKDPSYLAKLKALPPAERERFLGGNWNVREAAGDMFQRSWFPWWGKTQIERLLANQPPLGSLKNGVNVYDFAGTPFKDDLIPGLRVVRDREARTQGDADWSARMRLWRATDGTYVIDRIQRYRDTPGAVREWLLRNATEDGPAVVTAVWQDPGQAGVDQIEQLQKEMIKIKRRLHCIGAPAHSKEAYARLPSRLAFAGRIILHPGLKEDRVAARFLDAWFNESEQFPEGEHDDMVDCLSLAILYLENFAGIIGPPLHDPTTRFARAGAEFMMNRAAIAASRQALRPRRRMSAL